MTENMTWTHTHTHTHTHIYIYIYIMENYTCILQLTYMSEATIFQKLSHWILIYLVYIYETMLSQIY